MFNSKLEKSLKISKLPRPFFGPRFVHFGGLFWKLSRDPILLSQQSIIGGLYDATVDRFEQQGRNEYRKQLLYSQSGQATETTERPCVKMAAICILSASLVVRYTFYHPPPSLSPYVGGL